MYRINRFAVYAALFFLLTIEEIALHHFDIKGILPDTLMIFVIFFGLFSGIRLGIAHPASRDRGADLPLATRPS